MNIDKRKKVEILLDGIGEIDDALLSDALTYKKRRRVSMRTVGIAAAIAVAVTMTLSIALVLKTAVDGVTKNESVADAPNAPETLDSYLCSLDGSFEYVTSESDLPYYDDAAHVVWQYADGEGYYVSDALSNRELKTLVSGLGRGEEVGEVSQRIKCKVWVLLGDGRVISPYLKPSAGNVSNGIFDYEAEIIPDESVVKTIAGILS